VIRWATFLLVSFSLFFAWEMAQAKFFASMQGLPFWAATIQCLHAAGGDLLISAAAFGAAALVARHILWPRKQPLSGALVVFVALGLAVTVTYELYATSSEKWSYNETMPVVAGIGLLPLLQWTIIPLIQVALFRTIWRNRTP
jgi:hypothetical protein